MPGENIYDWSPTAANNDTADSLINWREGMARAAVNDSARSMMAAMAKFRDLLSGTIVTGGTPNTQTFTSGFAFTSIPLGLRVMLKIGPGLTNTGAVTLNMDSIADTPIKDVEGNNLAAGDLTADTFAEFRYDGTNWVSLQNPTGWVLLAKASASNSATVDFTSGITSSYDEYIFVLSKVRPSVDADLYLRISIDGGATWKAGTSDYYYDKMNLSGGAVSAIGSTTFGAIFLANALYSNAGRQLGGELRLHAPHLSSRRNPMTWHFGYSASTDANVMCLGSGYYTTGEPITGVRFYPSTGSIAEGEFALYGVRK